MAISNQCVVVGAGIGGLSCAIRLATAGFQVTVVEKNESVGGKMAEVREAGFRWDTGPSVITMRHVFADLFQSAGRRLEDYIRLLPVDPLTRYFYADGTVLDATDDVRRMAQQIRELSPADVAGYEAYLKYAAEIHRVTGPVFIYDQPPTWRQFLQVPLRDWFKADGLRTMNQAIEAHVQSPKLRQLLGRFATYVGASPYIAPATLNVIAHVELSGGVWYPAGGIYQIAEAMAMLARELGVVVKTNCAAARILHEKGVVAAVETTSGERLPAGAVISNVDVSTTFTRLLPDLPYQPPKEMSCSGFVLLLGIAGETPALAHHNIFFSDDYPAEFTAIFDNGVPAEDPTIYVAITSKTDKSHAPDNHENWFVLINAPAANDHYRWSEHKQVYRDLVLEKLAGRGFDVTNRIKVERILTPDDLAAGSGAWQGALYGASSNDRWAAFRRPHNRSRALKNLYFTGGTTHPGGGVPMVTLSGKVAADLVIADMVDPLDASNLPD